MAPRRDVDKGKRPMDEIDPVPGARVTRSRTTGVRIGEIVVPPPTPAVRGRGRGRPRVQPHPVEQQETRGDQVQQQTTQGPRVVEVRQTERVGAPDEAGPSRAARQPDEGPRDPRVDALFEVISGLAQQVETLAQTRVQQRTPIDPSPMERIPVAQAQGVAHDYLDDDEEEEMEYEEIEDEVQPEPQDAFDDRDMAKMRAFHGMQPPSYSGDADYRVTDRWVLRMEKLFGYLRCNDEQKVRYATFMLEGDADEWWRSERRTLLRRRVALTWAEFLSRFLEHYIPASEKAKRAAEFMALVQGKSTVAEYDVQFRSLARFVRWTRHDAQERARKFQEGLKLSIRGKLAVLGLDDYDQILDRARRIEREEEWAKVQQQRRGSEQPQQRRTGGRGVARGRGQRQRQGNTGQSGKPMDRTTVCYGCGQPGHIKTYCPNADVVCFICGQKGHKKDFCPQAGGVAPQQTQQQPFRGARGAPAVRGKGRPPQIQQPYWPRLEQPQPHQQ